ncbi:peptidylprolyl isomerase [Pseudomarimonas salicorniae]|uniref:Chaperone SurA n=1 Tax=Pseudomarimonas salicorniae TaxID=2933270 RepID=A0ABT0GHW2_9GAMM|nr:peptidylprolyl isomerase [Lysobacter sp. CAU 1642]MCK7594139.1 peptidylprolyl isomerase [Lysobacter sp. CAU 1642]
MTRLILLLAFVLTGLGAANPLAAQSTTDLDSIVAVVEEDVILRSELDMALNSIYSQYAERLNQLPPRDVLERQVLERLVLLRLQLQRAESAGIRIGDSEVEQAIVRIAEQNRISVEQMRQQLARDGMAFDEFRRTLRDEMIAQRLRQNIIQSRVNVSDTEIDILLTGNSLQRGQVNVGMILVAVPDNPSQEQLETARKKVDGVRDLLVRGEMDFSAAAIRYSDAPNALEGGEMGWRSLDGLPPLIGNVLQGLKVGEVSQPIRDPNGFLLLKAIDRREDAQETVTEYNARDILIRKNELVDSAEAKRRIDELRAKIEAGADFAELARKHSQDDMTAGNGGDMGWFQAYAWGNAVGETVLRLEDGELSQPFESDVGWHLVQRLGSRQQDVTEETERNRARETIGQRKAEEEYTRFLRQLREESYVDMRLG